MGKKKSNKIVIKGKIRLPKSSKLLKEEKELSRKLHSFLDLWKGHVKEEIEIHKKLLTGKRNLKQHVQDTLRIHEKFIHDMRKLVK